MREIRNSEFGIRNFHPTSLKKEKRSRGAEGMRLVPFFPFSPFPLFKSEPRPPIDESAAGFMVLAHPASSIQHPASSILHPASGICPHEIDWNAEAR
jgi:hypothetical protein